MTVTPVTYIRPGILIFTGVIHKEGNASDSNTELTEHKNELTIHSLQPCLAVKKTDLPAHCRGQRTRNIM